MAKAKMSLPRYTRAVELASGETAFYWELPAWAKRREKSENKKCPVTSEPLGNDLTVAKERAEVQNSCLDSWRSGVERGPVHQSVAWLFSWYQEQDRYTKNSAKTRKDYWLIMKRLADEPMKSGKLGERKAGLINATIADTMYARWRKHHGERQASYAMQVARLVWNWAVRHHDVTGVTFNPFKGMGIASTAAEGNRETSRAEYNLYRETAREMGFQSMATAAAIGFELCQRVWDVFGFVDDDGKKARGFVWTDYKPGRTIAFTQSKTGKKMLVPLIEDIGGDVIDLFPELEAELELTARQAIQIIVDETTGLPLNYDQMNKRHRKICAKAGLPKEMTFTGFRHGGITELGDAGIDDTRPISGHVQLQTTAIYNRASQAKAKAAQVARNRYLAAIASAEA